MFGAASTKPLKSAMHPKIFFTFGIVGLCAVLGMGCAAPRPPVAPAPKSLPGDLSIYRKTDDQATHEWAKTAEFLVPVGQGIPIRGLEFERGDLALGNSSRRIISSIFNCLEEITENTAGDTEAARVAEFSKMEFEIRAYAGESGNREQNRALAQNRAEGVRQELLRLGTPSWRLSARGFDFRDRAVSPGRGADLGPRNWIEFVRTR